MSDPGQPWLDYQKPSASSDAIPQNTNAPWLDYSSHQSEQSAAPAATWGSRATNLASGFESGLLGLAGSAQDIINPVHAIAGLVNRASESITGKPWFPKSLETPSAEQFGEALGLISPALNPANIKPNSWDERLAKNVGLGLSGIVIPGAEGGLLANAARNFVPAIASGIGKDVAEEAVPDNYKGIAGLSGGLLGGLGGGAAMIMPSLARTAKTAIGDYTAPFTASGQARTAAEVLATRANDPSSIANIASDPEIVRGSAPTTFQASGDMGLGSLEREVSTRNPQPFMERRAEQNSARLSELNSVQSGGDPNSIADFLRAHLDTVDQTSQQNIDDLIGQAHAQTQALGGNMVPEAYGVSLRSALQDSENAARTHERGLWNAVDPDKNLMVNVAPTRNAATTIVNGMTASAKPMSGEEAAIFDVARNYDPQAPLAELGDLRSRVSTAMRDELIGHGASPTYARLSRLRGAIQGNLNDGVLAQGATDVEAPNSDTIASRLQGWVDDFKARQQSGAISADGSGATTGARPTQGLGANGAGFYANTGFPGVEGAPGIPQAGSLFDQAAADRLAAATEATRTRARTFGTAPNSAVLSKAGSQDLYKLPDGKVPEKFFHPGPTGYTDVASLRGAVGDDKALPVLQDYAAMSLRRAAEGPDGTLDPAKVAAWQSRHADSLRAFPELNAKFSSAANASQTVADAISSRTSALKAAQAGAIGRILNASTPEDVTQNVAAIFGSRNSTGMMSDLVKRTGGNQDAMNGLRQAVADHISSKFISNTEAGTSGENLMKSDQFQTFMKRSEPTLSQVFSPEEVGSLRAIAADLNRANRSVTAVKLPGQSNTPQDIYGVSANRPGSSIFSRIVMDGMGAAGTAVTHSLSGGLTAWLGAKVANAFRNAGIEKVNDLLTQAMLHPDFAKALLIKAPSRPAAAGQSIISTMRRAGLLGALTGLTSTRGTQTN